MKRECIAVRVRLINRVISSLYDEGLRPFGLRISQANILSALANMGEARPADVSRALRIEKSTLSRDLDLLRKKGWVEAIDPAAPRLSAVRITREGLRLITKITPAWEETQDRVSALIGPAGAKALGDIAERLGFTKQSP